MRWFGWFRKAPPEPPALTCQVNVIGSIKLPEPTDPRWKVESYDRSSAQYIYGEYGRGDYVYIWCWHPDKTGKLQVGDVELLKNNNDLYTFGQAIYDVHGSRRAAEEKRKRIKALEALERMTGSKP